MRKLGTAFTLLLTVYGFSQSDESISTINFVETLNGNQAELLHYYQNNWKVLRDWAMEDKVIESYEMMEVEDEQYDLVLITTYRDQEQFVNREPNFVKLIDRKGDLRLMNGKQSANFRKLGVSSTGNMSQLGSEKYINEVLSILIGIREFSPTYVAADYKKLSEMYAPEGQILPPEAPIITGREAIEKRWTVQEGIKILHHKITPEDINILGNTATDVGYYEGKTRRADGEEFDWSGKYVIIWKKINGQWLIDVDIWNLGQ